MYEKKDLLIIFLILITIIFIFIFFPTKKFELYIGKSSAIINDKNKSIIVRVNFTDKEKIRYRIYPFFVKIYIQPIYYGNKTGVYKNEKPIIIKNNKEYELDKLGAYNILTIDYIFMKKKYNLYVLDGGLPIINIDLAKKGNEIVRHLKIPMSINIISNTGSNILNSIEGIIKKRGIHNGKYNISFSNPVKVFGLPERKKWSLVGSIKNQYFFTDKVSFDLYGLIDSKKIYPKTFFTELFIDGTYRGIFTLEEYYDYKLFGYKKYDKIQINPALIFKCKKNIIFRNEIFSIIGNLKKEPEEIYEIFLDYFEQVAPNSSDKKYFFEICDLILFILYSPDEEFFSKKSGIYSKLDINNFIDNFLLIQLLKDGDNIGNNLFFSRKESENINEKNLFIITNYDHDWAFGSEPDKSTNGIVGIDIGKQCIFFERLFNNSEINDKIKKRWFELRKDKWSNDSILSLFEQNQNIIKNSYTRIENQYIYDNSEKRSETLEYIINDKIEWMRLRLSWLDDYFSKLKI